MKKIRLLTGLSTLSALGVGATTLTSCQDPKTVSMTLVYDDEEGGYILQECKGFKTITLEANVKYIFKANISPKSTHNFSAM